MAFITVDTKGLRKLNARMEKLDLSEQRLIMRKSLRKAWAPTLVTAKQGAPVDTGQLRRGLRLRAIKFKKKGVFGVSVMTPTREKLNIDPSSPWYYPGFVEYGTRHSSPNPFMRRAFVANQGRAVRDFARNIAQFLEQRSV